MRFARLQSRIFREEHRIRRLHEVLPCFQSSAFETIDKAHLKNSLAEYVTRLPRTINLSGTESGVCLIVRKGGTYDEIRRGQTERSETYGASHILSSYRGYVEKSMARTYINSRKKLSCVNFNKI